MTNETSNHDYHRPPRGTKDWGQLLNENFARLDRDVQIRDTSDNIDEYEPKEGAIFIATDTKRMYVGGGSEWRGFGSAAGTSRSVSLGESDARATVMSDGTLVAKPGQLQSVIDYASNDDAEFGYKPCQTVKLVSGTTYEISDTVRLKRGVRLECNGARIVPDGDFNVIELVRETQLIDPFIDTRQGDWSSTQVVIGPEYSSKLDTANRAWVRNAYLLGPRGKGTGIQFRGGGRPCSMQVASGTLDGFNRALDFYASGGNRDSNGDWTNGNQFWGRLQNYRIGISMRSEGAAVSGNTIRLQAQPNSNLSEWLWKMERDPRDSRDDNNYKMVGNTVLAHPWDVGSHKNNKYNSENDRSPPFWFIGRGRRYANSLFDMSGRWGNSFLVNNSDTEARNGIFTAHGGFVSGTQEFKESPAYEQNSDRQWHPSSR